MNRAIGFHGPSVASLIVLRFELSYLRLSFSPNGHRYRFLHVVPARSYSVGDHVLCATSRLCGVKGVHSACVLVSSLVRGVVYLSAYFVHQTILVGLGYDSRLDFLVLQGGGSSSQVLSQD